MLMDSLGNRQSFDRWKRYCFVQACDPKWVRKHVCDAFGGRTTGRNLKWLRHSLIFLMRQFVKGNSANSSLPVYKLFAHSESTDAWYAIEKLAGFPPERCTNTTDMRLILNTLWQKINLEARRANPYIRMGEIGTVGIWSPKTRSVPEFVHWAVRGPHAPSCPGRRAKKNWIWIFFLKNFEFVCFGPSRFGSSFRKKNPRRLRTSASARKRRWIFPRSADQYRRH